MASVGKSAFSASLLLTAREQVKSSARCPGLFFLPSFFFFFSFLNTSTPRQKSLSEDRGREGLGRSRRRRQKHSSVFTLRVCVCVEPSGAKIIKINIYESSTYFFSPPHSRSSKLAHFEVIKPRSGSHASSLLTYSIAGNRRLYAPRCISAG